jgi:hypothetical protein
MSKAKEKNIEDSEQEMEFLNELKRFAKFTQDRSLRVHNDFHKLIVSNPVFIGKDAIHLFINVDKVDKELLKIYNGPKVFILEIITNFYQESNFRYKLVISPVNHLSDRRELKFTRPDDLLTIRVIIDYIQSNIEYGD